MKRKKQSTSYVIAITLVAALGGLLFGYDTAVISGAIGCVREKFGLTAGGMGWAASSALLGCVIGVSFAGLISDRLGRRTTLLVSAVLFALSALGIAFSHSFVTFIVFRIIGGIGIGTASVGSPMYIAEIAPAGIRGRLVSLNQLGVVTGILVVYFVNYFIAGLGDHVWNVAVGWRWMFASGLVPSLLFLLLLVPVPESPRWLAEKGRHADALKVLMRIGGKAHADIELAAIENSKSVKNISVSVFSGKIKAALGIGIALAVLQQATGINVFLYYAPEIFKKLGSGGNVALLQTVLVGAVNLAFTFLAIYTVDRLGRKPLMIIGSIGMAMCLFFMGMGAYLHRTDLWILVFILGYIACFAMSVGPVVWVILSEIFPTSVRGKALGIATFLLWVTNFIVSQTFPMMDENPALVASFHHAFPFWVYGLLCVVTALFVWRAIPETKGKSLEDIERMWI